MDWINWSRTWATRRTTTTSRKPPRCSSKILRWKQIAFALASRSKAEAKPQRRTPASLSTRTSPIGWKKVDWCWARRLFSSRLPSVKTTEYSSSSWSSTSRRSLNICTMAGGGGNNKIFQYCTDPSGQEILHLRALEGHSGRNLLDPSLQDNVVIPNGFFKFIYHIGCAINLHSIVNSGLIPGGQILSKRQTVFFTSVDPMNKEHQDPDVIDLNAPRLAWYKQHVWKQHQNTEYLGWHQTCSKERI